MCAGHNPPEINIRPTALPNDHNFINCYWYWQADVLTDSPSEQQTRGTVCHLTATASLLWSQEFRQGKCQSLIIMIAARASLPKRFTCPHSLAEGSDFEVWLYRFIVPFWPHFLPYCIPREPLIWAFIKQVQRHGGGAPALVSHEPSASSKSSVYFCYEGHVERATGVTLRDALRDNCLTTLRDLW